MPDQAPPHPARPKVLHGAPDAGVWREVHRSIRIGELLSRISPSDVVRRECPRPGADLVSVIIPMRDAREWIEVCLKGILAQTHGNLEVFCVDDCSADDTFERVVGLFGADRRVCAIRLKRGVGPYQIKNWAIATVVRGVFVAMQDADDISHPSRIAAQVSWMREHGISVCGTHVHQFSVDGTPPVVGTRPVFQLNGHLHNLVRYPPVPAVRGPDDYRRLFGQARFFLAKHGSQIYDHAVLREFGGFDGRTTIGGDTELNWRLLRFMDIGNVPRVLYSRRIHAGSLTRRQDTGYDSPARRARRAQYEELQQEIARSLAAGDAQRARALCTRDLYHGDVEVAEIRADFDLERRAAPPSAPGPVRPGGPDLSRP